MIESLFHYMRKLRFGFGLWMTIAIMALPGSASALSSPVESNPVFQALLASLLGTEALPEDQKLERLEGFLKILQSSFEKRSQTTVVHNFQEYLALRNRYHNSPESAYQSFLKQGLVTPLTVRASTPQVMEAILTFETQEAKNFLKSARLQFGEAPGIINIQAPIWDLLPELYLGGKNFRDSLDRNSDVAIRQSFEKAEEFRQKGNPAGIFSWILGTGLSIARKTGETLVNPLAEKVIHGEFLQDQLRQKVLAEIIKLRNWPKVQKLELIQQFESTMQSAISDQIQTAARQSELNRFAHDLPLADVIKDRVLPEYFKHLSPNQKSAMVWAVFSHPHFSQLKESQQMQIIFESLGPFLPYWLRQMSRLPAIKGSELTSFLCCQVPKPLNTSEQKAIQEKFLQSIQLSGLQSVKVDPLPLATSPLKDTYLVTIKDSQGARRLVFQMLRPNLQQTLQADLATLKKLQAQSGLMTQLAEAGAPQSREMLGALIDGIQEDADLKNLAARQKRAGQAYQQTSIRKIGGQQIEIEIKVATTLETQANRPDVMLQEYAAGEKLSEARKQFAPQVEAALESFGEIYVKEALGNSGFIWSEPREDNMRVEIQDNGGKVKLTLMNFGGAQDMTRDELKKFYSALGKVSIQDLIKIESGNFQIEEPLKLVERTIEGGLPINLSTLRFAQGFMHLRDLLGAEKFRKLLLRSALKQPSLLWSVLGPRFKSKLQEIYDSVVNRIHSAVLRSNTVKPPNSGKGTSSPKKGLCSSVHST